MIPNERWRGVGLEIVEAVRLLIEDMRASIDVHTRDGKRVHIPQGFRSDQRRDVRLRVVPPSASTYRDSLLPERRRSNQPLYRQAEGVRGVAHGQKLRKL